MSFLEVLPSCRYQDERREGRKCMLRSVGRSMQLYYGSFSKSMICGLRF